LAGDGEGCDAVLENSEKLSEKLGVKGDVDRYILWLIVLLILLIVIVALFYAGAYQIVQAVFIKNLLK